MTRALVVIGDAAEILDTFYPLHRMREDGHTVHVAGPEKRMYHLVQHDTHPDWDITVESPGYKLRADIAFRDIDPDDYGGLVLSGGRAPEYIRYDPDLQRVVKAMHAQNKPIASICHGIEILAITGVIKGRTITTVKKCRFDAEAVGAIYVDREVVVDGNLVCARTYHDNWCWMREYMKLLNAAPH
ncbi:MAG: DJ-1/PfpI family protein [Planctomycetota bacterium]